MVRRPEVRGLRRFEEPPDRPGAPNLNAELDQLPERFRAGVVAAAEAYRRAGVRAVLIGGLAAGAYGRPRSTKDIDFLVGDEAWDSAGIVISLKAGIPQEAAGVTVDNVPIHIRYRALYERALSEAVESDVPGVRIARPEMLAVTKLEGGRSQDIAAVVDMLRAESIDLRELTDLVRPHDRLRQALDRALREWEGER